MNVCVFCSASDLADKYVLPARQLAKLIAEHGHSLVWGGSDIGVMKVMADGVQAGGGQIFGISVEILKQTGATGCRRNGDCQGSRGAQGDAARPQ